MPVYEYRCKECGENFELFVRSVAKQNAPRRGVGPDGTMPHCPKCGSPEVKKAISLFGVAGASGSSKTAAASCGLSPV